MKMSSKFFRKLSLALMFMALAMAAFGAYYVFTFRASADYPACQPTSGLCGPLYGITILYTTVMLGCMAFGLLSLGHSRALKKREDRNRDY